jgi:hypothetical protein
VQQRCCSLRVAIGAVFISVPARSIYGVTLTNPGFQTFAVRGVPVNADATVRVNAALEVGKLEPTVEVSMQAATLRADSAEVRSEIGTKSLEAVPVALGRIIRICLSPCRE